MRFCMVTTFYPPYNFGGDGLFVQSLSRALAELGHEVQVVHCLDAYRLAADKAEVSVSLSPDDDGVTVHRLRHPGGFWSPLLSHQLGVPALKAKALNEIFSESFDVVNFHNTSLMGAPGLYSYSQAPVNLYTFHDHWLVCPTHSFWKNRSRVCDKPTCLSCTVRSGVPPQLWRYFGDLRTRLAPIDKFLSPSLYTAEIHRQKFPELPVEVMPTFSNLGDSSRPSSTTARSDRFLFAGRLVASKGVVKLLDEFEKSGLPLDLAGDGPLEGTLRSRFAGCDHIRFLGRLERSELKDYMQRALAVVVPSLAPEVFPLVCLEAMECGTPVVCSRAGGCSEAVEATGGGLSYSGPEELRSALSALVESPLLVRRLGELGRSGHGEHYTRARYLERYLGTVGAVHRAKVRPPERPPLLRSASSS